MANSIPVPHPGETIREDVLEPLGMSVNQLAKALGITATRLNDVVRGRRGITADNRSAPGAIPRDFGRILARSPTRVRPPHRPAIPATRNREDGPTAVCRRLDGEGRVSAPEPTRPPRVRKGPHTFPSRGFGGAWWTDGDLSQAILAPNI